MRDLSFVGSGAGGNVYTGTWCGMPVAVKFMLSGDVGQLQRQQREAALSRLASHPHLVQTYAVAAAQLTPSHFVYQPGHRRVSGLSHTDLLATYAAGGATAADLYGTTSVSPAQSTRIARMSFTAAGAAGSTLSGPQRPSGIASGKGGIRMSCEYDRSAPARQGTGGSGGYQSPLGQQNGGARPSSLRMQQQQQQFAVRSSTSVNLLQPSGGSSCGRIDEEAVGGYARQPQQRSHAAGAKPVCSAANSSIDHGRSPRDRKNAPDAAAMALTNLTSTAISAVDMEAYSDLQVDGKADSFVMEHSETNDGLILFQPSDVLVHIGARPGQWLTVVIMEEMDRGSLHRCIHNGIFQPTSSHLHKRHRVRAIVRTLLEVAQGMAHLHSAGLVHGDLKPANVLLKSNSRDVREFVAKVSDFGVTRAMADGVNQATVSTSDWGTVIYTAPEVFNGKAGPPSDVFSFGVLTWHLTTGQMPHEDINPFAVMLAVSRGELELEWPASVPRPLRKLGRLCMQFEPSARPTFAHITRALIKLESSMRMCARGTGASSGSGSGVTSAASNLAAASGSLPQPAAPVGCSSAQVATAAAYLRVGSGGGAPA
ncbi:hypothetical protein GPECTOR_7g1154 [Gonium pectorale]|uniref:Protein kinase domain-containing protein n=1 Tax=Gonium pectorale TaxID=33097 RepID=A0A150GV95_GONPE|nr:hypothetical protein GPECTOR_7g1154 [Gonium pectorale]|eukprot:KXZ53260.1 hypothetical protein GPECTOR_7g1154 [Gonium pectorale]